jgi:hypothetical protein
MSVLQLHTSPITSLRSESILLVGMGISVVAVPKARRAVTWFTIESATPPSRQLQKHTKIAVLSTPVISTTT